MRSVRLIQRHLVCVPYKFLIVSSRLDSVMQILTRVAVGGGWDGSGKAGRRGERAFRPSDSILYYYSAFEFSAQRRFPLLRVETRNPGSTERNV